MALSLAPLYFRYGVALYHIGRAEIFSNATNAASKDLASAVQFEVGKHIELPSDSEESDGEECADSMIDPKNDVNSNAEVNTCVEVDSKCEVDQNNQVDSKIETNQTPNGEGIKDTSATEQAENKKDNSDTPETTPDDLTLAWEALDTARCIYLANPAPEFTQPLIDVFQALGDVSMESEAFPQAAIDYSQALTLLQESNCPDQRIIAEAHYKIALAYDYSNEAPKALESLQKALELLKSHHSSLSTEAVKERAELEELFLELEGKIADLSLAPQQVVVEEKEEQGRRIEAANVNDLTALVKRKAVPLKEPENEQENCKRAKESEAE